MAVVLLMPAPMQSACHLQVSFLIIGLCVSFETLCGADKAGGRDCRAEFAECLGFKTILTDRFVSSLVESVGNSPPVPKHTVYG